MNYVSKSFHINALEERPRRSQDSVVNRMGATVRAAARSVAELPGQSSVLVSVTPDAVHGAVLANYTAKSHAC